MIDEARNILEKAGWTMVGHYMQCEYWTDGESLVCLYRDEVKVISGTSCLMSMEMFVRTKGEGVL